MSVMSGVSGDICVVVNGFDDEFGEFQVFIIEVKSCPSSLRK